MKKECFKIRIINQQMGELLNDSFVDRVQFKLFLKLVNASLELQSDLSYFNGETFLINIPYIILKDSVVLTSTEMISTKDQVRSKIEAFVTIENNEK